MVNGSGDTSAVVAYGPETIKRNVPMNTGIMIFSFLDSYCQISWSSVRLTTLLFSASDQGLINAFFDTKPKFRAFLPFEWNYKVRPWTSAVFTFSIYLHSSRPNARPCFMILSSQCYWGYPDVTVESPPRIMHFHGPKPTRGLYFIDCLASMNRKSSACELAKEHSSWPVLGHLINIGFSRDGGRLANKTLELFNKYLSQVRVAPWRRPIKG